MMKVMVRCEKLSNITRDILTGEGVTADGLAQALNVVGEIFLATAIGAILLSKGDVGKYGGVIGIFGGMFNRQHFCIYLLRL